MTSAYDQGNVPQIGMRHRLLIARTEAGLSQDDLADRMQVARSTISNAEKGKGTPHRSTINAWAMACGVPASWLRTGEAPTPPDGGHFLARNQSTGWYRDAA